MKKMPNHIFVKPIPPGMIRDPRTRRFLEPEGEYKPDNNYWRRRIRMKDVELVEHPPKVTKTAEPKVAEPKVAEPKAEKGGSK